MDSIDKAFTEIRIAENNITRATQELHHAILELEKLAGKTFEYHGQYFQIQVRKNKATGEPAPVLKRLRDAPKGCKQQPTFVVLDAQGNALTGDVAKAALDKYRNTNCTQQEEPSCSIQSQADDELVIEL